MGKKTERAERAAKKRKVIRDNIFKFMENCVDKGFDSDKSFFATNEYIENLTRSNPQESHMVARVCAEIRSDVGKFCTEMLNKKKKGKVGYYIQTSRPRNKAADIYTEHPSSELIPQPASFAEVPEGKGLICVVDNGPFEAAAFCFDEWEFEEFIRTDEDRTRTWILMPRELAEKLSGFRSE